MPEILAVGAPAQTEPPSPGTALEDARRCFATAQALLMGGPTQAAQQLEVGWHDTSVSIETGSFAVVQINAGLDDLLGEVIRVSYTGRVVFALVVDIADVPTQVSVTRSLFARLNRLTVESVPAEVVVVD